jgi:hypothetical protein
MVKSIHQECLPSFPEYFIGFHWKRRERTPLNALKKKSDRDES